MALARLRQIVPPISDLPPAVAECLGPEVAAKGVLYFCEAHRQTTNLLRTKKQLLLWLSYTTVVFSDVRSGAILRLIPVMELRAVVVSRQQRVVLLRAAGEHDALLYLAAPDAGSAMVHPKQSAMEVLLERLVLLKRVFSEPGTAALPIEEYRDVDALKSVALIVKPPQKDGGPVPAKKKSGSGSLVEEKLHSLALAIRHQHHGCAETPASPATVASSSPSAGGMSASAVGPTIGDAGSPSEAHVTVEAVRQAAAARQRAEQTQRPAARMATAGDPRADSGTEGRASPPHWSEKEAKVVNPFHCHRWEFLINKNIDEIECERRAVTDAVSVSLSSPPYRMEQRETAHVDSRSCCRAPLRSVVGVVAENSDKTTPTSPAAHQPDKQSDPADVRHLSAQRSRDLMRSPSLDSVLQTSSLSETSMDDCALPKLVQACARPEALVSPPTELHSSVSTSSTLPQPLSQAERDEL